MNGIEWHEGDEIITLKHEFPNQFMLRMLVRDTRGMVCKWDEVETHVSTRTRLVALSTVNYETDTVRTSPFLIPSSAPRNVLVYLDGTQSVGALGFDCQQLNQTSWAWMLTSG